MADGKWMEGAVKNPGSLRKTLHVKEGHDIPEKKLAQAERSKNPTERRRAALAKTFKKYGGKK